MDSIPDGAYGFIYKTVNLKTGQYYIGKKNFFLKKKEKGSIVYVESGWKTYLGSSSMLLSDVQKYGTKYFKRDILCICYSKAELTYKEVYYLFKYNVLEDEKAYNSNILGKFYKANFKEEISHEFKNKVLINHKGKFKYVNKSKVKLYI